MLQDNCTVLPAAVVHVAPSLAGQVRVLQVSILAFAEGRLVGAETSDALVLDGAEVSDDTSLE